MTTKIMKRKLLRNNEYYNIQDLFDNLYSKSSKNYKFKNLYQYIISEENIKLAYRNIKNNKGSRTSGVDNVNVYNINKESLEKIIKRVQNKLSNYKPQPVKRIYIPKNNGTKRPLGIPTFEDRLIQQCIKQILEPICEAKFHKHSYGFRPNRKTEHALARFMFLVNNAQLTQIVDIDIKSFFDNVNHSKLLKQIWNLGIQDKQVICIISKILKSEIQDIGIPNKGVPQGGILSPLLSNIVLNELDWWLSSQWETFKTKRTYSNSSKKFRALRSSKLKEFYFVRYADDFKIICKDYGTAKKIFESTKLWLKDRLQLEVNLEKSKITNIKNNYTEFLGFKLKAKRKNTKIKSKNYVCISKVSNKAKENCILTLKQRIKDLQKHQDRKTINRYNATVLGMQNYYRLATLVSEDFKEIAYVVNKSIYNRLINKVAGYKGEKSTTYNKLYSSYSYKTVYVSDLALFPIQAIKSKTCLNIKNGINNYTHEGRELIHTELKKSSNFQQTIRYLLNNPIRNKSILYNDNRISLFAGQNGKCAITNKELRIGSIDTHHKIPIKLGGTDEYSNLIIIDKNIHILIHATEKETIKKYIDTLKLDYKTIKKINKFRKFVGNKEIVENI